MGVVNVSEKNVKQMLKSVERVSFFPVTIASTDETLGDVILKDTSFTQANGNNTVSYYNDN